ncbi:MAG: UDP-N-acetylglucosamine 2-epimerase (hydrolyzing) [Muribaculaceae bacterium]|nr:UDP-N-acetylglucosamine 2-epimerase (hydrolyzing) [Muribaculaceae bacterium]
MKRICFITGTRADYGIMAPIMRHVMQSPELELQVVATNMHLSERFGNTYKEIENDGFKIEAKIYSVAADDSASSVVRSMAAVQDGLSKILPEIKPDLVVILGDRYEALASASAAVTFGIPVAHLHGGEITQGALDNRYRNAITQLSTYHFASTEEYRQRIISMGCQPDKVFHSGAPGAEPFCFNRQTEELFNKLTGLKSGQNFLLLAFHPVTLLNDNGFNELKATLEGVTPFIEKGWKVLVTMPNSDPGNLSMRTLLEEWGDGYPKDVVRVDSLGSELFHYAMENAAAMIGNSSAALIEAPTHCLPTVNVGFRQKGRATGPSVISVEANAESIRGAIEKALSSEFRKDIMSQTLCDRNPYYKKDSSRFIFEKIKNL